MSASLITLICPGSSVIRGKGEDPDAPSLCQLTPGETATAAVLALRRKILGSSAVPAVVPVAIRLIQSMKKLERPVSSPEQSSSVSGVRVAIGRGNQRRGG